MAHDKTRIRYAVVGLGHFAQTAILPAFAHAKENSELVAVVSGDRTKRAKLSKQYRVDWVIDYSEYDRFLDSGAVDAVYIALPNHLHKDFTVRAAQRGVHVLCEKPLAVSVDECREMIAACQSNGVKLMTAYRLHFEQNNLKAVQQVQHGKIGEPRLFASTFAMDLREGNVRGKPVPGSGPLFDIGTYCINAARGLFRAEPEEVFAMNEDGGVQTAALLRFPKGRLATFAVSFDGFHNSRFDLIGTKGLLQSDPAFGHQGALKQTLTVGEKVTRRTAHDRDQIAPEIIELSNCILEDRQPEASGEEGLLDVRIIEALQRSARERHPVRLPRARKRTRPSMRQQRRVRPHRRAPRTVKVASPGKH
ncbi:MAG: Gfo/Idh/MocA family oxidoreductase [Archangiaceae bacterium]|nr:Gfo/Idh/MocA family oxidoreductase [Archangiaceae bacterium]